MSTPASVCCCIICKYADGNVMAFSKHETKHSTFCKMPVFWFPQVYTAACKAAITGAMTSQTQAGIFTHCMRVGKEGSPEGGREPAEGLPNPLDLMGGPPSFRLPAGDAMGDGTPDVCGERSCIQCSNVLCPDSSLNVCMSNF